MSINRRAAGSWTGDLPSGTGTFSTSICTLEQIEGDFKIAKMKLTATGTVPNALRSNVQIELEANLS
jgi:hypothetical protein